jgi:hypothetical protein
MRTISSPWKEMAHAIWRSPSSLAMHSAWPSYAYGLLRYQRDGMWRRRTLFRTAMDAYELPKLMPTTVGTDEISIGASALPFGMFPLAAMSPACDVFFLDVLDVVQKDTDRCRTRPNFSITCELPTRARRARRRLLLLLPPSRPPPLRSFHPS